MIGILAGCFPNCTPDPSSGVTMANGSNTALGLATVLLVGAVLYQLLFKGSGKGKGK